MSNKLHGHKKTAADGHGSQNLYITVPDMRDKSYFERTGMTVLIILKKLTEQIAQSWQQKGKCEIPDLHVLDLSTNVPAGGNAAEDVFEDFLSRYVLYFNYVGHLVGILNTTAPLDGEDGEAYFKRVTEIAVEQGMPKYAQIQSLKSAKDCLDHFGGREKVHSLLRPYIKQFALDDGTRKMGIEAHRKKSV